MILVGVVGDMVEIGHLLAWIDNASDADVATGLVPSHRFKTWLRRCTYLKSPTIQRYWMIGSLLYFLNQFHEFWKKSMQSSSLFRRRWQVLFSLLSWIRLMKACQAYAWVELSQLFMVDLIVHTLYETLYIMQSCSFTPTNLFQLLRATFLLLRSWLGQNIRNEGRISN